jgi:CheY-like chemotaxis protein
MIMDLKKQLDRVLLVDDDESANFLNKMVLTRTGMVAEIVSSLNGEEALKRLDLLPPPSSGKVQEPLLMFLDINMPVMDGWEFLEHYKEKQRSPHAVIYLLSTSQNPDDVSRAKKISLVKGFLHKPLTAKDLNAVVVKHYNYLLK